MSRSGFSAVKSLLKIGLVANIFEYYELSIYGYMAPILGELFFPSSNKTEALLKALLAFTCSYLVKPLGGFYFGWLGDQKGRSIALKRSLFMMSLPTAFIGLLPTWHHVGIGATILLVSLRVIQGFASGGEGPISVSYIFESSPPKYRSLLCSAVHVSAILGILSASGVTALLFHYFSRSEILDWAWRIPFLIGIPLTLCIIWIRHSIIEPTPFLEQNHKLIVKPAPANFFKSTPRETLAVLLMISFFLVAGHILFASWFPIYLKEVLGYPAHIAYITHTLTLSVRIILCLSIGYLTNFIGIKPLMISSLILSMCCTLPLFLLLNQTHSFGIALGIQLLFALFLSGIDGTFLEVIARLFPRNTRCRGISWIYTFLSMLSGSTTPILCIYMSKQLGFTLFPAFYLTFFSILAAPAIYLMLYSKSLSDDSYSVFSKSTDAI